MYIFIFCFVNVPQENFFKKIFFLKLEKEFFLWIFCLGNFDIIETYDFIFRTLQIFILKIATSIFKNYFMAFLLWLSG